MDLVENKEIYKDIPVSKLDLSVRSSNCLHRANIATLYELIEAYNKGLLLDIRNLGKLSFDEIANQIHAGNGDPSMRPQQQHASTNACTSFMLSSHTLYENSGCHCTATANR